jgi:hypothetical protein
MTSDCSFEPTSLDVFFDEPARQARGAGQVRRGELIGLAHVDDELTLAARALELARASPRESASSRRR